MGNATTRIKHVITRPIREYNLQDSAHKAVLKNRDLPSPRHPSTRQLIEQSIHKLPDDVKEELSNTNQQFKSRLEKVFVTSKDVTPIQPLTRGNPNRPLPSNRSPVQPAEYGNYEPKVIPYGKTTLSNALDFIAKHQEDPGQHKAEQIALKHKLDIALTENVLSHFGTFRLVMPVEVKEKDEKKLAEIKASPSFLPQTPENQKMLSGIAMKNKPDLEGRGQPVYKQLFHNKDEEVGPKGGEVSLQYPSGYRPKGDNAEQAATATMSEVVQIIKNKVQKKTAQDIKKDQLGTQDINKDQL